MPAISPELQQFAEPEVLDREATIDKPSVAEVLVEVQQDSRRQPQGYLDEVVVPFGGE